MGGIKKFKKGDKGENLKYITRNEAIKKLQVSLKVFRKLCILKGVHPRDPKKKIKGANKTYYYTKDIKFLQNEKILEIIRARKSFKEKEKKLISKKEFGSLKKLKENRPMITLDHIIRERYPTFQDALKDLDDCLSLIHLFANMDASPKIRENQILACEKLSREFQYFITQSKSLRKVFVSVKGVYYQAEIMGETITWLTPINYLSKKEKEVDYGVMISFLEFYQALLKFVNYRLYSSIGLEYPPKLDEAKLKKGEGLSSIFEQTKQLKNKSSTSTTTTSTTSTTTKSSASNKVTVPKAVDPKLKKLEEKISQINSKEEKEVKEQTEDNNAGSLQVNASGISKDFADLIDENTDDIPKIMDVSSLFKGFHFYVGREVPRGMLEFTILSFGGKVSFQGGLVKESSQSITHQIVDRTTTTKTYHTREYIQPQWVFDSINSKILLPYSEYTIGVIPPPHLSPFVEYDEDSYIPARKAALDELINSKGFDQAKFSVDQETNGDSDDEVANKEDGENQEDQDDEEESDDEDDEDLEHLEARYTEELRQEQNKKRKASEVEEGEDEDEDEESGDEEEEEEKQPEAKPVLTKKQREELKKQKQAEEDTKLAELMIRKKDKWIYNKVKETNQQKAAANQTLLDKRNKVESGKDVNGKEKATPASKQQQTTPQKTTPQKPQQPKSSKQQPASKKQKK